MTTPVTIYKQQCLSDTKEVLYDRLVAHLYVLVLCVCIYMVCTVYTRTVVG